MRFSVLFVVLASTTLYLGDASIVIDASIVVEDVISVANEEVEDKQLTNNFVKAFQGALPPGAVPEESLTAKICSCNKLLLSSLGPGKEHLAGVMGVYTKYGEYNSKAAYFGPNSTRLYFLPSGWIVSDSVGKPTGFIHNGNKSRSLCAYEIPDGWLFFSGRWYHDTTLVLRCIP